MKKIFTFKTTLTYEVEADNYEQAVKLRDGLEHSVRECIADEAYEEEVVERTDWDLTHVASVEEVKKAILKAIMKSNLVDEENDEVYKITDKGLAYLNALEGKGDYDENDFDENGHYIKKSTDDLCDGDCPNCSVGRDCDYYSDEADDEIDAEEELLDYLED